MTYKESYDEITSVCYGMDRDLQINIEIALIKQIPKKPNKNRLEYFCPCHAESVVVGHLNITSNRKSISFFNYCPHCGQAIDWSE